MEMFQRWVLSCKIGNNQVNKAAIEIKYNKVLKEMIRNACNSNGFSYTLLQTRSLSDSLYIKIWRPDMNAKEAKPKIKNCAGALNITPVHKTKQKY